MDTPALCLALTVTTCLCACGEPTHQAEPIAVYTDPPTYVGRAACADCHEVETDRWMHSHHDLAMDVASAETVLGDFDDATFEFDGIISTFSQREGRFFVRTDGPDGALQEYEVAYVFGVTPLQQYLIPFPRGRYQVLPLCWDTRPADEGGQRWFHLYPDEGIDHTDTLHWTRISQNWNHVCAECHSTDLRKEYDLATDTFATSWEEIDVSCEACHGPASRHVEWARAEERGEAPKTDARVGLTIGLRETDTGVWVADPETGTAKRSVPRTSHAQTEMCARCHSRRIQITDDYAFDRPLLDTHLLTLLDDPLYYADGQILGEDYVYGSFVQSKMYREGVTCNDCHHSHSLQLHAPGNAVCSKCHLAERFDTPEHHFHEADSTGASCVECHMPATTYMVVDPRHDHSIRIPRPDLSVTLGTPNACNACHTDETAAWAADAIVEWYGPDRQTPPHFGEAIHAGRTGAPGADAALSALANDDTQPAIARATALSLLPRFPSQAGLAAIEAALGATDPLMRSAAARALEIAPPEDRLRLAASLLTDPVRSVRYEAASTIAGVPREMLSPPQQKAADRAIAEYIDAQLVSADRPEAHLNIGVIEMQRGRMAEAEASYRSALRFDAANAATHVNLADLYRATGRDVEGERILRDALALAPEAAPLHYALGLTLIRLGRTNDAVESLGRAARLEPENARLGYTYALGLDAIGASSEAIRELETILERHPNDRDVLMALMTFNRDAGDRKRAASYARRLLEFDPESVDLRRLIDALER